MSADVELNKEPPSYRNGSLHTGAHVALISFHTETAPMPCRRVEKKHGVEKKKRRFSYLAKSTTYVTDFGGEN